MTYRSETRDTNNVVRERVNNCRDRLHWRLERAKEKYSIYGAKKYEQGKRKIDSDWPENEEGKLESGQKILEGSKCQH